MTRILTILLAFCLAPLSAAAQVAVSTTGDVGSTATRNGYPIGGGAVSLPSGTRADGTAVTTTATTTATGTTAGGGWRLRQRRCDRKRREWFGRRRLRIDEFVRLPRQYRPILGRRRIA